MDTISEVKNNAKELRAYGFELLSGPRLTVDGYFEFETLDPDNKRLEVITKV
jgi:lactoylglutathione lyase